MCNSDGTNRQSQYLFCINHRLLQWLLDKGFYCTIPLGGSLNKTLLVNGLILGHDVILGLRDVNHGDCYADHVGARDVDHGDCYADHVGVRDVDHGVLDSRIEVVIHIIILDKIELEENLAVMLEVDHILDLLADQILDLGDFQTFIVEVNRNLAE
jgi:hypothetical protein